METVVLADGIRLHHFHEERFKSEYLSANLICPPLVTHSAHSVLLSSLMGQSNARYPKTAEFSKALETAYNTSFSSKMFRIGETRIHPFAVSWLSERFVRDGFQTTDFALDFLASTLFEPHLKEGLFPEKELQKQIKNRIDDLAAEKNNKQRYALKQCVRELCKGEPFATPLGSTVKDLQEVTPASLHGYYTALLEKAPVEFYYFGRTPAKELAKRISLLFAPLFTKKDGLQRESVSLPKSTPVRLTEEAPVSQSTLCLGFKTPVTLAHPLHPAQVVLKEMLSDSPISLLFTNVREKESLCYYCSALSESGKGLFVISGGVDKSNVKRAEEAIFKQIETMQKGDFSEDLLFLAKKSLISSYKDLYDSPAYLEAWYLRRNLFGMWDSPADMAKKIEKVTREEIVSCANLLTLDTVYLLEGQKGGEASGMLF
jgi:predicted Zn-dependent peptidase